MDIKRLGKALLFPHMAIMLLLVPVSVSLLVYSMGVAGSETAVAYISYVLAAYTLTVWCFRVPYLIKYFKSLKNENKYVRIWLRDMRLRVNITLYSSMIWNLIYAIFQLCLGLYNSSLWFCSLAAYYLSLALMRLFLARYIRKNAPGENMRAELSKYRVCGIAFLLMNLALTIMILFMVYWNRTFNHHEITTIAMAAYTFTSLSIAVVNIVKYRKYNSPVYSASKAISLAAACVSMLTLESTMLTTFGDGTMDLLTRKVMLGASGCAISVFIIAMAVYMIVQSTKKLRLSEKR